VERARELLGVELAALVGESYERAYGDMVRVQQLTELEEVIGFSNALTLCNGDPAAAELHRVQICEMWRGRLKGVQRNVEVWQALLSVRTLVLPMAEDTHTWLKFASLCRKSGRVRWERCAVLCCAVLCWAVCSTCLPDPALWRQHDSMTSFALVCIYISQGAAVSFLVDAGTCLCAERQHAAM